MPDTLAAGRAIAHTFGMSRSRAVARRPSGLVVPAPVAAESGPVITCRAWQEGDERRGMRAARCMVDGCPNTLAVTASVYAANWGRAQFVCERDAVSYGLHPLGKQSFPDTLGPPPGVAA